MDEAWGNFFNFNEGILQKNKVQSIVMVTTDKCYENTSKKKFFHENDKLGGNDPYSASKAASEILINSYKKSYFKNNFISTARAGNVIGGGDFNKFRIIPDRIAVLTIEEPP